jgi:hypothetical protein
MRMGDLAAKGFSALARDLERSAARGGLGPSARRPPAGWRLALAAGWSAMAAGCAVAASVAQAAPIPSVSPTPVTPFYGAAWRPQPVRGAGRIPQSRFMAANGLSEIHDDEWQSDLYTWGGPLGRAPQTFSDYLAPGRDCGSITFDRRGRVISICIGASGPELYMFDPATLAVLASFTLPGRTPEDLALHPGAKIFQDFSAGGYFYLSRRGEIITGTTNGHIYVIAETPGPSFRLVRDYPLGLGSDEEITSQEPDSHGLLWFTAQLDGVVGTLNLRTGSVHEIRLGNGSDGEITKSLATDSSGGVYIPTNHRLYRFVAGPGGVPRVSWSVAYPNTGVAKPGMLDAGTGTTPVLADGGRLVGIDDNADPIDVVIYRTAVHPVRTVRVRELVRVREDDDVVVRERVRLRRVALPREVCRVPVFTRGASAGENAMIASGRSYVIENNYGYQGPQTTQAGATAPGLARIDVRPGGRGCRLVWTNITQSAPSVVSKMSLANGLIYTYTVDGSDDWYWTTLDFRTGRTVYRAYAGTGVGYNNNYAGIALSPRGVEYLGTLGGIIGLRDG